MVLYRAMIGSGDVDSGPYKKHVKSLHADVNAL